MAPQLGCDAGDLLLEGRMVEGSKGCNIVSRSLLWMSPWLPMPPALSDKDVVDAHKDRKSHMSARGERMKSTDMKKG